MRIYGLAIMLCVVAAVGGCSEQTGKDCVAKSDGRGDVQSEDAAKVRDRLFGTLQMCQSGAQESGREEDIDVLLHEVSSLTNKVERDAIFTEFEDRLFSFDPSKLNYGQQKNIIDVTWHFSFLLRCAIRDATSKKLWEIRLKALAWVKHQVERIEKNDLESKWDAAREKESRRHSGLQPLKKPIREYFKGYIKRCATDIEEDKYSDKFREWAKEKMEKIIGRPLTDDDLWFKDDILQRREERKQRAHDEEVRRPHDGGDVLPHPFTFLGCTFGQSYDLSKLGGKDTCEDVILCWFKNFSIDPYFGKVWMMLSLAPQSKIAYSAEISWSGQNTREELFAFAKDIRADIEKRLGVKLGEFFFEGRSHVCDEATWWKSDWGCARSRSIFGPILIELEAADKPRNLSPSRRFSLVITDMAAEALVEKERKENPLTYDSKAEEEAERRKFEQLKAMSRRRKLIPVKKP